MEILRLKGLGVLLPTSTLPPGGVKEVDYKICADFGVTSSLETPDIGFEGQDMWPVSSAGYHLIGKTCFLQLPVQSPTGCFRIAIFTDFQLTAAKCWQLLTLEMHFLQLISSSPTIVTCELASGDIEEFALGKVLPGQRDGSLLWYQALTSFLAEHLHMESFPLYPCLLKSPDCQCLMLLHVDDILVVCSQSFS